MVGPCLSVVRKHHHLQSPDGITVSGNMAIAAAAVGRRKDAMMFFHEACLLKNGRYPPSNNQLMIGGRMRKSSIIDISKNKGKGWNL